MSRLQRSLWAVVVLLCASSVHAQSLINCDTNTPCTVNGPIGTGRGDTLYSGGAKINANFSALPSALFNNQPLPVANGGIGATSLSGAAIPVFSGSITSGRCVIWLNSTTIGDAGASCGGGPFSSLSSGTNTSASMLVGNGASLGPTGTGVVSANQLNGAAVPLSASALASNASGQLIALTSTGTGNNVLATSPTLVTPALGTPSSVVLTNATGLPATALPAFTGDATTTAGSSATSVVKVNGGAIPTSAAVVATNSSGQFAAATTTGSGSVVLGTSPTLVTPALGTPSALVLTNASGLPATALPALTGDVSSTAGSAATTVVKVNGATVPLNASVLSSNASGQLTAATTTGTGANVLATSPTLVTPALGTPSSAVLTNATGLPISTGVTGLGTGVATALGTAVGSAGAPVINGGALGTPSSATLTNASGLPLSGVTGFGTGVATALANNVGSAGAPIVSGGALGTPSSGTLTNATGLPIATGVSGLGTGVATALGTAVGSPGAPIINGGALGTPASATLTNATGLPLSTGVTGTLATTNGGTGASSLAAANIPVQTGAITSGHCVQWATGTSITDSGAGCGSGGSNAFSALTSSTNTSAAMVVGTGASLAATGSGAITATAVPVSGVSGLGTGVGSFLTTPTSANLAGALTDETGTGAAVFSASPTLTTPNLGTPSAITLTNATFPASISAITTLGGLTSANGSTVPASAGTLAGSTGAFTVGHCLNVGSASPFEVADAGAACGTGGSAAFNALTSGTNTSAAMVIGTGASLAISGGGTIAATNTTGVNGATVPASASVLASNASSQLTSAATTGSGSVVLATSPTLTTPALGTPSSATLTNATGLPISTGVSGLGTGVATALGVAVGSAGSPVINGGALGTPSGGVLTNATGLPLTSGVTGTLGTANGGTGATSLAAANIPVQSGAITSGHCVQWATGTSITDSGAGCGSGGSSAFSALTSSTNTTAAMVVGTGASLAATGSGTIAATSAPLSGVSGLGTGVATALGTAVGSAGAPIVSGGALGTPSSGTLTNATGLPVSTGISGLGTGIATFLATPSSANLAAAVPDETGSGSLALATSPTLVTPAIKGSSTGVTTIGSANASVTNYTATLPANTGTVAELNLAQSWSALQTFPANDISIAGQTVTGVTGTGSAVLATSPTLTTPNIGVATATSVNGSTVPSSAGTLPGSTGTFTLNDCLKVGSASPLEIADSGSACGSGGSGTVNSGTSNQVGYYASSGTAVSGATLGNGLAITGGTLAPSHGINAQTGTTYTVSCTTDAEKLITFKNASTVVVTLPAGSTCGTGFKFDAENLGAGTVAINPVSGNINGSGGLSITTNLGCTLTSDGTNYQVSACSAAIPGGGGSGTVSSGTSGQLAYYSASGTTVAGLTVGNGLTISSGTIAPTYGINAQTGTTYTFSCTTDAAKLVTFSNAASIAASLPQATSSCGAGYGFDVQNLGAGTVTITPTTSTINGASTLTIASGRGCSVVSDGTNYQVSACTALVSGGGNVSTSGTPSTGQIAVFASSTTVQGQNNLPIGVNAATSATSVTPNCTYDVVTVTASATGTFTVNAPATCTPANGQRLRVEVLSPAGGTVTYSFNAAFKASATLALPTTSNAASKEDDFEFEYSSRLTGWKLMAYNQGF